jgi:hypothetical protein
MATPMSPAQFAAKLRAEGATVVEVGDWETHNRNHKGPWGPVHGVMIHHTVTRGDTKAQTDASVALCRNGHSQLPGPLCHGVIAKDGTVYLVGYGRTNHAGMGDDDVEQAVINETNLPIDDEANTDGNRAFYGFEAINLGDGKDPWPEAQLLSIERVSAAICRHHGWSERSVIGHLEWQPGKVDPRGFTMASMRARVAARLRPGPSTPPKPPAPSKPSTGTAPAAGTGMGLQSKVLLGDWIPRQWPDDKGLADRQATVNTLLGSTYGHARAAREGVDALREEVADLRAAVVKLTAALTKES